jgi:3D (Asp-Asp-Asp) domain-containing protein
MQSSTLAAVIVTAITATAGHHATPRHHFKYPHHHECVHLKCKRHADRAWGRLHHWQRISQADSERAGFATGESYEGTATYYSPGSCDATGGGETTASGTQVHFGEVANSVLALGTRIWVEPAILGRHDFTVEDRFGSEQSAGRLDVWLPCGTTIGNPWERFRVVR